MYKGKKVHLGYFGTKEEADAVYKQFLDAKMIDAGTKMVPKEEIGTKVGTTGTKDIKCGTTVVPKQKDAGTKPVPSGTETAAELFNDYSNRVNGLPVNNPKRVYTSEEGNSIFESFLTKISKGINRAIILDGSV